MHIKAQRHLSKSDKKLAALIQRAGPCTLVTTERISPYQSLVRSVVYQQLHGKAAATILARLLALFPNGKFPKPEQILALRPSSMRKVGLSNAKMLAIRDIALKTSEGLVPSSSVISKLSDQEIIDRLTSIRGVGIWTVQMMLIFKLGRLDVLPATDFGVQKGFSITYKRPHPTPKQLLAYGERWQPYRSIASWYMWRATDAAKS